MITRFEVFVGSTDANMAFWHKFFGGFRILPLTDDCVDSALEINKKLRSKNKQIAFPDLLIAATAKANDLPLVTLNAKHFARVEGLNLLKVT